MRTPIRLAALALLTATLSACSFGREVYEPAPVPPVVVKVPTYVPLPADATRPCAEPAFTEGDFLTGLDALSAANGWKVTAKCNRRKLEAIGKEQPVS